MNAIALTFQNTQFDVIDRTGQPWLRLPQIGAALEYANPYKVQQLYDRNSDEFTEAMTAVVELDTNGGKQQVRIFSLRGCHLLGMLARTKVAKEFRKWVLDVLDRIAQEPKPVPYGFKELPASKTKKALPGCLTCEQQDAVKALVKTRVEQCPKPKQGAAAIACWSSIKSKFGRCYKEVPTEHFAEVLSLVARLELPLEGELLPPEKPLALPEPDDRIFTDIDFCIQAGKALNQFMQACYDAGQKGAQPALPVGDVMDKVANGLYCRALHNRRFMVSFQRPFEIEPLPMSAAVIDPSSRDNLKTLVGEYVPVDLVPEIVNQCLARLMPKH